jgi:hypothetical protein
LLLFLIGHGPPAIVAYFLVGFVSAGFLFTGRRWARLIAIAWQGLLMAGIWSKIDDPHDALMSILWVAPATVYLGVTAILQFSKSEFH